MPARLALGVVPLLGAATAAALVGVQLRERVPLTHGAVDEDLEPAPELGVEMEEGAA
jgi:hypothetical protein